MLSLRLTNEDFFSLQVMGEGFCNFCIPEYIEKRNEWRIDRFQSYFFHIDLIDSEKFFLKYIWCILSIFDTFHSVFFTCFLTKINFLKQRICGKEHLYCYHEATVWKKSDAPVTALLQQRAVVGLAPFSKSSFSLLLRVLISQEKAEVEVVPLGDTKTVKPIYTLSSL